MIAPLLVVWFDYDLRPKIAIVALVCFFPIVVSTIDALDRSDADLRKLLRSFGASRWQTFRLVEAPAALPGLATGREAQPRVRRASRRSSPSGRARRTASAISCCRRCRSSRPPAHAPAC